MTNQLNAPQREAVQTLRGPLLVLAGAGSGKTRVVTFRIAELIRSGIKPARILAVTFTNKAAKEMQSRIASLLGRNADDGPQVSTFHSHCVRVLRRNIRRLGYPEQFSICDRSEQESVARKVLRELRTPTAALRPGDLISLIGFWKTRGLRPDQAAATASTDREHLAATGYRRYQQELRRGGTVDFDDLLLFAEELLTKHPEVRRAEAGLFDHLLVDEYQDTNGTQYRIVRALAEGHRNLCVVGDDDQSIYAWRGAEVANILRFSQDWPDAKVVRLMDNYRCTSAILQLANQLIQFNRTRHPKELRAARAGGERPQIWQAKSEVEEARLVVDDIRTRLKQPGAEPRDFAILFRTNEQPRVFEMELRAAHLPYVLVGGMSFFDRREVRDMLAYLRVLQNPNDESSLRRIINTPPRGIGEAAVDKLLAAAVQQGKPLWQVLHQAGGELGAAAAGAVGRLVELIERFAARAKDGRTLVETTRALLAEIRYKDELARTYPDVKECETRQASIEEVINALANYIQEKRRGEPDLGEFLEQVAMGDREMNDEKEKQLRKNAIVLMTLHAAKGLEFPQVYLVGLEEGFLPHHRSLADDEAGVDEERRLTYVGITRAQDRLTISFPLARMKWGKPRPTIPSRFIFEMTGQAERAPSARRAAAVAGAIAGSSPGKAGETSGRTDASHPGKGGAPQGSRPASGTGTAKPVRAVRSSQAGKPKRPGR